MAATTTMSEMKAHIMTRATEDGEFRAKLLADPKPVISAELGVTIPEGFTIQVHENSAATAHMVLPMSEQLTEEDLAQVAGGWGSQDAEDAAVNSLTSLGEAVNSLVGQ